MDNPSFGLSIPPLTIQIESMSAVYGFRLRSPLLRIVLPMTLLLSSLIASGQTQPSAPPPLPLMPLPAQVKPDAGEFLINNGFGVALEGYQEPRLERAKQRFLNILSRETGIPLWREAALNKPLFFIKTTGPSAPVQQVDEDESYHLQITGNEVHLEAANPLGVLHGLQTFLQLVRITPRGFVVPAMTIDDHPRFPWRGLMLDAGRHFMPLDVVYRTLDGMEAVKLNVFHWHLSDNQGFRVESRKFPLLQEKGSDGLFYTQEEIREVVAYAHDRGIRIVPEFDMPGHSTAWFVGYPELASGPGPYQIERKWGVFDPAMDPTQERTYKFLDAFIGEMAKLFPDQYFHIGGDEVNGKQWDTNPQIQAFMRAHGLKTNQDLQAYFNTRVQKIVSKHGKTMVGWDEILRPDLPKDIVVQSWRGQDSLAAAARQGYRGILSYGYYLDLMWPASRHYAVDPMSDGAANLTPEEKQRILGGEACMWSEYVSPENIDSRIWPRTAAIAERLWSPQDVTDVNSMYQRLDYVSRWLDWLGLTHNSSYGPMLRRIAGSNDISTLRTFTDVAEPVKDYTREEIATVEATSLSPLNRVVDAARPESDTARHFADLVDALIAGQADPNTKQEVRTMLTRWRDNQSNLQALETQSFLLTEIIPLAQDLSAVATTGLQALDYLDRGERASDDWATQQFAVLAEAQKPKAQLLLMVAPSVQKLVEASS